MNCRFKGISLLETMLATTVLLPTVLSLAYVGEHFHNYNSINKTLKFSLDKFKSSTFYNIKNNPSYNLDLDLNETIDNLSEYVAKNNTKTYFLEIVEGSVEFTGESPKISIKNRKTRGSGNIIIGSNNLSKMIDSEIHNNPRWRYYSQIIGAELDQREKASPSITKFIALSINYKNTFPLTIITSSETSSFIFFIEPLI